MLNLAPTGAHKVANVLVIRSIRMLQHIITIVRAETGQGFLWGQVLQSRKGKQFAGAVVLPGFIRQFAILEDGGGEVIVGVDNGNGVGEGDAVWLCL